MTPGLVAWAASPLQEQTPPEHTGLGKILATFTAKQVQDFSAMPSLSTGYLCQRRRKGKSPSTPGLSAWCKLWVQGFLPLLSPARMGGVGDITRVPGGAHSLSPLLCASSGCSLTPPKCSLGSGSSSSDNRAASPALQPSGRSEGGSGTWAHFLPQLSNCLLWLHLDLALVLGLQI